MSIVMFRANPRHQRDPGLFSAILGAVFVSGILYYVGRSVLRILNGEVLLGIAGLIPFVLVFFLLIAALGLTNGGERP